MQEFVVIAATQVLPQLLICVVDGILGELRLEDFSDGGPEGCQGRGARPGEEVEEKVVKEAINQTQCGEGDQNGFAGGLEAVLVVPCVGMAVVVVCDDLGGSGGSDECSLWRRG